jgi:DNA (cytosine-5)-methyltransferase 1
VSVYYNENNAHAAKCLAGLMRDGQIPRGDIDTRSIQKVRPSDLSGYLQCHFFSGIGGWPLALRFAEWPDDKPIWTGSCPCQPFSSAGKGAGFADERHLWPDWMHLIRQCNPARIFGEQVASKDAVQWIDAVFDDLENTDYACSAFDLCASGVQAQQIRQRLYWVANSAREHGKARNLLGESGERKAQESIGRLPRISISEGRWSADGWGECMPVIVPSANGISKALAGIGNAIVPQLAAEFIRATL